MARRLSPEEDALWARLKQSVRPLRPSARTPDEAAASGGKPVANTVRTASSSAQPKPPPRPSPLLGLEEKEWRRLRRRLLEVDDRIDLHGMTQERAFAALAAFLRRAQARGQRIVLVVTGKGRSVEGRGILREAVPQWIARPDFRPLVSACEEAGRRHGGEGALYVRIRRRQGPAAPASS